MSDRHVHISIGPVQGFVAQSRRTRDLWGSSYLLSFLAAHAMRGAQEAGGTVVRPEVKDDPLLSWVSGNGQGAPPNIGSLPNQFVVAASRGHEKAIAQAATDALGQAWRKIADAVYAQFVKPHLALGHGTQEIWERQVASFWEVAWVAGAPGDKGLLARRKHWRTHRLPQEGGDKCTVMSELQELSGDARDRKHQRAFWAAVRGGVDALDLQDNERLSAVAFTKRLFPHIAKKALGWKVERKAWPSTVYLAALPWLDEAWAKAPEEAETYARAVQEANSGVFTEYNTSFPHLREAKGGRFTALDANWLHQDALCDPKRCPLPPEKEEARETLRDELRDKLRDKLRTLHNAVGMGPSTHYALLLADGDRLGELVGTAGPQVVGKALAAFTQQVPKLVEANHGVTVYAGGDDVLAMLPLPQALKCAEALASAYRDCFKAAHEAAHKATMSVAVVLAPIRTPLSAILSAAHHLLDDSAKEANGRDSLGVAAYKGDTAYCQWVTSWSRGGEGALAALTTAARLLTAVESEPGVSASLLYRVREQVGLLANWPRWAPGTRTALAKEVDLSAFLRAELVQSLREQDAKEAPKLAKGLMAILTPHSNTPLGGDRVEMDGLMLAHFLNQHSSPSLSSSARPSSPSTHEANT